MSLKSATASPSSIAAGSTAETSDTDVARLHDFVEAAADWFWELDAELCYTYVSDSFCIHFGVSRDEIIGKPRGEAATRTGGYQTEPDTLVVHKADIANHRAFRDRVMWRDRPDGQREYVSQSATPVFDDNGKFCGYRGVTKNITDLFLAQSAWTESEGKFHRLFEDSKIAKVVRDADDEITHANAAFYHLTGYSKQEFAGRKLESILHPDEVADHNNLRKLTEIGELSSLRMERRFIHKEGHVIWVETSVVPNYDENGVYKFSIGEFQDISERKFAEEGLRASEQRYRTLLESLAEGVSVIDQDRRITYVNDSFLALTGYSREELIGQHGVILVPEVSRADLARRLQERQNGDRDHYEVELQRRDGGTVLVSVAPQPVFDELGNFQGSIGVYNDITARRRAEEAVRRSAAQARAFLDATFDRATLLDRDGVVIDLNDATSHELGLPRDQIIGTKFFDRFPPHVAAGRKQLIGEVFDAGRPIEMPPTDRNGRYFEGNARPVFDAAGDVEYVAIFTREVTERIQAERTIIEARDQAENASRAKSQFLAAASHDLRQPLQAASLLLDVLAEGEGDANRQEVFSKVRGSVETLSSLLNAILEVSRLDAGVVSTKIECISLQELLPNIVAGFQGAAIDKSLNLKMFAPRINVKTDRALIETVLHIFIANAIKFTQRGGILVGARRCSAGVRLEVWDSGIGIEPGEQNKVFEEFYQVQNQARDRNEGLGLGLAVANRTADLLGHEIQLRSWPDRGSVFSVTLPIADETPAQAPIVDQADGPASAYGRVVIVDDEPAIIEVMEMILADAGHEVMCYRDFRPEASAMAAFVESCAACPDAIICDYRLPNDLTGLDIIQSMRQSFGVNIPAALLTGELSAPILKKGEEHGCSVLHKPISAQQLKSSVLELIKESRVHET